MVMLSSSKHDILFTFAIMFIPSEQKTICALSTPSGAGAIAVIRLSGKDTFSILGQVFSKDLSSAQSHTTHFGMIKKGDHIIDEVVATIFRGPNSFTGEDVVEISCHGSAYIQQQIIQLLLESGASMASPGEFTMRAFFNGKMDLSQAEAVADLIASSSAASHQLAMQQMRGGFSKEIAKLRQQLIDFASLIELELDFSEEDVEFADRQNLKDLVNEIQTITKGLIDSFAVGNVIKNGVPVAIVGVPNVGKSTLLNALLQEERAIVSNIPGTTRDSIEDKMVIEGIEFRFIDTAGLRETADTIEKIGIERTYDMVDAASIVLYMVDAQESSNELIGKTIAAFQERIANTDKHLIIVANKIDQTTDADLPARFEGIENVQYISAKEQQNIDTLKQLLVEQVNLGTIGNNEVIVTNSRHYEALSKAHEALLNVQNGLNTNVSGDFLAMDIRQALHYLGEITGEITTDDLLGNIFGKFCIGK
jgi:tRNA modification GTPase